MDLIASIPNCMLISLTFQGIVVNSILILFAPVIDAPYSGLFTGTEDSRECHGSAVPAATQLVRR